MPTSQTSAEAPPIPKRATLEYARPSGELRKQITQYVLYGAVCVAIVISCAVIPVVWDHFENARWGAQLLALQQQCLSYSAPAEKVVYDSSQPISNAPAFWIDFNRTVMRSAANRYTASIDSNPVVFLHERTSPSGTSFLICIQQAFWSNGLVVNDGPRLIIGPGNLSANLPKSYPVGANSYFISVIKPAANSGAPIEIPQAPPPAPVSQIMTYPAETKNVIRIYAGQIDLNSRSHFTIRYDSCGVSDTIDGYVDNNGQVTLSLRHPPATAPALVPVDPRNYSDAN